MRPLSARGFVLLLSILSLSPCRRPRAIALRAGELTLVLGDQADHGGGGTGYIGAWSLTSQHEATNVFVPRYAGFIQGRATARLWRLPGAAAAIQHVDAGGTETIRQTFQLVPPYAIDCVFERLATDAPARFGAASYINGPQDPGLYFVDPQRRWQRHYDPVHGHGATILPDGAAPPPIKRVARPRFAHGTNLFFDSLSGLRYHPDYALFYGRFRAMVLVFMFPPRCGVLPAMSPDGGGVGPDGRRNPAWDWYGHFRGDGRGGGGSGGDPALARLPTRVLYKRYVSDDDILDEYRRWTATLPR